MSASCALEEIQSECIEFLKFKKNDYKQKTKPLQDSINELEKQITVLRNKINAIPKFDKNEKKILKALSGLGKEYKYAVLPFQCDLFDEIVCDDVDDSYLPSSEFLVRYNKYKPYIEIDEAKLTIHATGRIEGYKGDETVLTEIEEIEHEGKPLKKYRNSDTLFFSDEEYVDEDGYHCAEADDIDWGDWDDFWATGQITQYFVCISLKDSNEADDASNSDEAGNSDE